MILWFLRVLTYLKLCCFTIFLIVNTFSWVSLVYVVRIFYCFPFTNKWILSTLNVFELLIDMIRYFLCGFYLTFALSSFQIRTSKLIRQDLRLYYAALRGHFVLGYIINIVVTLISQGFFSVICQKEKLS